ncbi:MAG: aminopeptidase [Chloroflexi bacterium]|nr:aminopeptidase [Chloroflexota bacterium]
MSDPRVHKFAQVLVDHSARIVPGDRVYIEATTEALPLVEALYETILQRGGHPYPHLRLPEQDELFFKYANDDQLKHKPIFRSLAYDEFESRIRIHSLANTNALNNVDANKQSTWDATEAHILETQMRRGAAKEFKWVTTLYPTRAYAQLANMGLKEYEDFVFQAAHAHEEDPIAYWTKVKAEQQKIVDYMVGHDKVELRGPNVDLSLSIKGRTFENAYGEHNMPDGEIYTGPVEDSLNGWVRYTYPSISGGRVVEDIELKFEEGRVVEASASKNEDYLMKQLDIDEGARYVGEFAIGTNFEVQQFTGNILFDEKIGGSFHMALGAGYPETGSKNKSVIHWDMICDMREDAEIVVDGEVVYKDGAFTI